MKQGIFEIKTNDKIAKDVYKAELLGDTSAILRPGQFVNIKLDGHFLRRPISVCDVTEDTLTLIYKVVGEGTEQMSGFTAGEELDILTGLGNGFYTEKSGEKPLLIGGGVGVPPLYNLCKRLTSEGKSVTVILGFRSKEDVFYEDEFRALGAETYICTNDGSAGAQGFVTDIMKGLNDYTHFYSCGPEAMLRAVYDSSKTSGQLSFEARMGCGFGLCVGCTCKTKFGNKRICKDGPVFMKEEIAW